MTTKQFAFLGGFQRSGATLLSSILNQNPAMWVSPASPLFRMMVQQTATYDSLEHVDYPRTDAIARCIHAAPNAFYADKTATQIVDKNMNWQTSVGLSLIATYITPQPKIICPVRSIVEILTSFDTIIGEQHDNAIDKQVVQQTIDDGRPFADRRADWLMRYDKDISICLAGLKQAANPQLRHMFLFVEYSDLLADPGTQIKRIYDFLEMPTFEHEFQNIVDPSGISEVSAVTNIKYLHKVRPKLEKLSRDPADVLLPDTIRRYSGLEFWREL